VTLPAYLVLKPNYPTDADPDKVKSDIGGEVNADWITNTCVVRISKAFNYAGGTYEIPRQHGLLTVKGADKKNYALRVAEFITFLRDKYGAADITKSGADIAKDSFLNITGIIAWHISGWSDATGHFTLWDGTQGLYEGSHRYFDFPTSKPSGGGPWLTKVEFWKC
jgi:hypothetical protein